MLFIIAYKVAIHELCKHSSDFEIECESPKLSPSDTCLHTDDK